MPREEVTKYQLQYLPKTRTVKVYVFTQSLPNGGLVDELPLEKAAVVIDMLRNEKPIYYYTDNSALQTKAEPVGEGNKGDTSI